jgi:hypothetical protein
MAAIETDYLVIGAGASAMAFTDALISATDAEVVIVDRRHSPGGHWNDAYPFVHLHQPSSCYGVTSRVLGADRIDEQGFNAGFYERATAAEVCAYYDAVLQQHFLPSGRVQFFGMSDYRGLGSDGHEIVSLVTGTATTVKVRRKLVDSTYNETAIPSRHKPSFVVDDDVRFIPPNDLVNLDGSASGYTVIGAGKTAMDTCNWLLDEGVAPERIRWIRPRDPWTLDRARTQPLELVGSGFMELQSRWIEAAADADSGADMARRLEASGVFARIDPGVEPEIFRGATLSSSELASLRTIENVVRHGNVMHIGSDRITLTTGTIPTDSRHVHVDCSAAALSQAPRRPIFESDRILMQAVTLGGVPYSAATIGMVEAVGETDERKNALCPPIGFPDVVDDLVPMTHIFMNGTAARGTHPDVSAWMDRCRLNPARGIAERAGDPLVQAGMTRLGQHFGRAIENLARLSSPA